MDDIFTLIIIIITIVSAIGQIAKSKKKSAGGGKPAARGELGTKLKAFFSEIQQRLEESSSKGSPGASPWDALQDVGQAKEPPAGSYELSLEDLELEEEEAPAPPVKKPPPRPARVPAKPAAARPVDPAPEPCAPEPLVGKTAPCPEFLRRAVVWSEILGPPLALRDTPWER
jgi:hypothetical protein